MWCPSDRTIIFVGLISRWIICLSWTYATALSSSAKTIRVSFLVGLFAKNLSRVWPSTYSITMHEPIPIIASSQVITFTILSLFNDIRMSNSLRRISLYFRVSLTSSLRVFSITFLPNLVAITSLKKPELCNSTKLQ